MRKSRQETAETRERIVSEASALFLRDGIDAPSLTDVMAAAGLKHGGFYRHFPSKDGLIRESVQSAFDQLMVQMERAVEGKEGEQGLRIIASRYLQQGLPGTGVAACPLASFGSELRHSVTEIRETATEGYTRLLELVARQLGHLSKKEALLSSGSIVSLLVGAVTLATCTTDRVAHERMLKQAEADVMRVGFEME